MKKLKKLLVGTITLVYTCDENENEIRFTFEDGELDQLEIGYDGSWFVIGWKDMVRALNSVGFEVSRRSKKK